jgi:release factor glutamine methyltransferase
LGRSPGLPRILDIGAGSGALAVTLQLETGGEAWATDISPAAAAVAAANARRLGARVSVVACDLMEAIAPASMDLIVSNPPYVADGDPHLQQDGLPFEPHAALSDGVNGGDGLACIRLLIAGARNHLLPSGWLLIEHGYDQAVQVRELLKASGFDEVASWSDDAGIERVSGGQRP